MPTRNQHRERAHYLEEGARSDVRLGSRLLAATALLGGLDVIDFKYWGGFDHAWAPIIFLSATAIFGLGTLATFALAAASFQEAEIRRNPHIKNSPFQQARNIMRRMTSRS